MTSYLTFESVPVFFIGRFVTGFGIGVCTFALPIYNSEVSTPSLRGATGSLFQVNVVLGQLLASIVTFLIHDWRLGMMLPGFAAVVVAGSVWLAPESPRYVMLKRGRDEGAEVLALVRSGDTADEVDEVMAQIEEEEEAGQVRYSDLIMNPSLRNRVLIACWLQVAQQFTGMNALIMFSSKIFLEMGFSDPFAPNMAFTALQVVGIIIGLLLLDSQFGGRRMQLMAVTATAIPLTLLIGLSAEFSWPNAVSLVVICAFAFDWQLAWGMIPWVYPSELFSMSERDRATSLAVLVQYLANALLMVVEPKLESWFGHAGLFYFFAAFNLLNLAFVYFCIKETKGVPLEDIPALFASSPTTEAEKEVAVEV
jgi:sugar porter (SP) family MFS transporter